MIFTEWKVREKLEDYNSEAEECSYFHHQRFVHTMFTVVHEKIWEKLPKGKIFYAIQ